jgi:hypothetical protein
MSAVVETGASGIGAVIIVLAGVAVWLGARRRAEEMMQTPILTAKSWRSRSAGSPWCDHVWFSPDSVGAHDPGNHPLQSGNELTRQPVSKPA